MTTPLNNTVKLTNPCEVLAALPHLLGFTPANSLVLVVVHEVDHAPRFGLTMRIDLPRSEDRYRVAEQLLSGPLRNQRAEAVLLAVIGERSRQPSEHRSDPEVEATHSQVGSKAPDNPPAQTLISAVRDVFRAGGISVLHAFWAAELRAGAEWLCYDEDDCRGRISDPKSSTLAATITAKGAVTFDSREQLQELVAPESAENLAWRAAKLDALSEDVEDTRQPADKVRQDLKTVHGAILRVAEGASLTEDDYARVLLALSDTRVRDLALSTALGEMAEPAERLWLALVRKAPSPELAEVAALLAFSAYLRGEGSLASVALERIEATRPEHRLGVLLRQSLDRGLPTEVLAVIAQDAAENAQILIAEDGGCS